MNLSNFLHYQQKHLANYVTWIHFSRICYCLFIKLQIARLFIIIKESAWNDKNGTDSSYLVSVQSCNLFNTNSKDV